MKSSTDHEWAPHESDQNSSDSWVEIKTNELVRRAELTKLDIRSFVVRCSSCGSQINHVSNKQSVKKHRKLGVLTCRECYEWYGSDEFSQDEAGYNYCTWCGNGGKLTVCDFCPNGFCGACIRRNFGRVEISETSKEGWKCYCCDTSRLKAKQRFCDIVMDEENWIKDKKEKKKEKEIPPEFEQAWLQAIFDDTHASCNHFHSKLKRLRNIGMTKSKSMKHVVMKVEQVITNHKRELKSFVKRLSDQYSKYIELEPVKSIQITNGSEADSDINEIEPPEKETVPVVSLDDDCVVIEDSANLVCTPDIHIPAVPSPVSKDSVVEQEPVSETNVNEASAIDEKTQAKLSLLLSSSDNDSSRELSSNEESPSNQKKPAFRSVQASSNTKINQIVKIELSRCDHLLKDGETTVKISDTEETDKLDKLVDSLCKDPIMKATGSEKQKTNASGKKFKAAPKEKDSSSSISLSSDDEQQKPREELFKSATMKAKADLMESDSSSSIFSHEHEEEEEEAEKPKSKKDKSISSEDDFLPNRKKRKYDKLLDAPLLDGEEKTNENKKKGKKKVTKKMKIMSSDEEERNNKSDGERSSSSDSSDSDEELRRKANTPRKKRRAKAMDEEDSSDHIDASQGKGRKNIKRIISEKKLEKSTKEAQLEEKERKRRIEDRQRLYNKIVDTSADGKEIITRKMVLEVDQDSKEEIVEIHPDLVCKLKPHQVNGVKFMWECTIESVKDLDKPGSGCILAHCMGLGKTLQVIAFLHTCLNNRIVKKAIKRAMIICPYNTCLNWAAEFEFWLHDVDGEVKVHQITEVKSNRERFDIIKYWYEEGGIIIVSYDIFRRLSSDKKIPKLRVREREALLKYFVDPGPDIVVCDEGHVLKNEASAISKATAKLATKRRIVLTGTPLQNNLSEYHCMLSFVKPKLLGTRKEFSNRFVHPITNGQYGNSTEYDVKLMKKRIHILHKLLEGCVQRCDYFALTKFLPPKHEYVISVKLSEIQMNMYECYIEKLSNAKKDNKAIGSTLFVDFNNLRCIWTHPFTCHTSFQRQEFKRMFKDDDDDMSDFINDDSPSEKETASGTDDSIEEIVKEYKTRSRAKEAGGIQEEEEEEEIAGQKQWYHEFISDEDRYNIQLSGKMVLLLDILKECETIGDKVLVFSQSLLALDAIEDILNMCDSQPVSEEDKSRDVIGRWVRGLDYFRMDGTTNADFRKNYIQMFNDISNPRARLFLISTRAGSLGTNLVGANRVVVFDTSWNPSHDVQAIFRVFRFGQIKPVYIYRFLAQGTMEEKIYDRQVTKLSLSCRVVDEQQIDRHFSAADLAELYTFDRNSTTNRPTPMLPKDRLLAEMLRKHKDWIVTYHEHDSLLQSQTEEDLTEEERQAAWNEYETEREGRINFNPQAQSNGDFDTFCQEPDFSSEDYDGRKIPDLKNIIENLYENIKTRLPGINNLDIKKHLLLSVHKVTQKYQEEHVKVLRIKQELIAHGSVPNSVNKFLEELSTVIKSTSEYIRRLQGAIKDEEDKLKQQQIQWQEQLRKMQQTNPQGFARFLRPGMKPTFVNIKPNMFGGNVRFAYQQRPPAGFVAKTYSVPARPATTATPAAAKGPTITEVEDDTAPSPTPSNYTTRSKKSTVIIEEIT